MNTAVQQLKAISSKAVQATMDSHEFIFKTKKIENAHVAQFTLDLGTEPGPWVIVGVNDVAFCIGYLPKETVRDRTTS